VIGMARITQVIPDLTFPAVSSTATPLPSGFEGTLAVAVSARYLARWLSNMLNRLLGRLSDHQNLPIELVESELGVTLPPAAGIAFELEERPSDAPAEIIRERFDCPEPPTAPEPVSENRAVLSRSPFSVQLPPTGIADHVGEFSFHYDFVVRAERVWMLPYLTSEGDVCIPRGGVDLELDGGLPEWTRWRVTGLPANAGYFVRPGVDLQIGDLEGMPSLPDNLTLGRGYPPNASSRPDDPLSGARQLGHTGSRIPLPHGPSRPGIGFPELPQGMSSGGEICFPQCSWGWETRRRVIATYLHVHADVQGQLIMDFDPEVYGREADGTVTIAPLPSPTPGIRLSVKHGEPDAAGNVEPVLTVTCGLDILEAPWNPVDLSHIMEWFERLCLDHTRRIMQEVTIPCNPATMEEVTDSCSPVVMQELLPPLDVDVGPLTQMETAYNFLRNLLVYQHLPGADGAALHYIVHNEMVFWPLVIRENLSRFLR
jgi:hypothetical protein